VIIDSENWTGVLDLQKEYCKKHGLPKIPCPQCLLKQDKDVIVKLDEFDKTLLELPGFEIQDLLPGEHPWLQKRLAA